MLRKDTDENNNLRCHVDNRIALIQPRSNETQPQPILALTHRDIQLHQYLYHPERPIGEPAFSNSQLPFYGRGGLPREDATSNLILYEAPTILELCKFFNQTPLQCQLVTDMKLPDQHINDMF